MPTIEVNGNIEKALRDFKKKTEKEGVLRTYRHKQEFTPANKERALKRLRNLKRRSKYKR